MILKTRKFGVSAVWCGCLVMLMAMLSACNGKQQEGEAAAEYELLTVTSGSHTLWTEYPAQVKGAQDVRIIPRVEGYLEQILVKEGQRVRKGQLLFVIDQTSFRADVKSAEANLLQAEAQKAKAEQEYESKQKLHEKKIISDFDVKQTKRDLDITLANVAAAKAQLDIARNNLSFTELRSPSDGVIGTLPYRKGDFVGPSTVEGMTVVSDNREMFVYFSLSEARVSEYLSRYNSMQEAIDSMSEVVLVLGKNAYAHKGKVESFSGIVDEKTGAVAVRAVFPNAEGRLLSGSSAKVRMELPLENVIVIPQEATYETLDKVFVYVMKDGKPKSRMVQVERLNDGKSYVVTEGLKAGEVIIGKGASLVNGL